MDAVGLESALIVGTRTLAFTALVLYLTRTRNNRIVRGVPLIAGVAATFALCALAWGLAAVDAFSDRAVRLAVAATIPLVQVLVLVLSLKWFIARMGRDPTPLPSSQFARDSAPDTLMHAFVLFVVTFGALFLIIELERGGALTP